MRAAKAAVLAVVIWGCGSKAGMKDAGTGGGGIGGTNVDGGLPDVASGAGGSATGTGGTAGGGSPGAGGSSPRDGAAGDGPACGRAGLPCCPGSSCSDANTVCNGGYVCTACGGPGQQCCNDSPSCASPATCHPGAYSQCLCVSASCTGCGGPGERCCTTGTACAAGSACVNDGTENVCLPCGGTGQACCPGDACAGNGCCFIGFCVAAGDACLLSNGGNYGGCSGGVCGCGKIGQPCCPTNNTATFDSPGKCSDPSSICNFTGLGHPTGCVHCGEANEPCCPGPNLACNGTNVCDLTNDVQPNCMPCGVTGNPCCANNKCTTTGACCSEDPTSGNMGRCVAAGASCTTFNAFTAGVCSAGGTCRSCGMNLEPCCPDPAGPACASPLQCSSGSCAM